MTSIAGIIYPDMLQVTDLIDPMLETLKIRSSDASDIYTFKNFQIGCLNAKIASNKEKNIFLMLDGVIENYKKLCQKFGLKNSSPEELLVHMFELFGIEFVKQVIGKFAIAILDQGKNTIFLTHDRIGKKPIYWYQDRHYFVFATEIKALLASGIVPQTPSTDAIAAYLYFGFTPQDLTPIKDVNKLLPAHYLKTSFGHGQVIRPYWSYSSYFETTYSESNDTISEQIDYLLRNSIQDCLEGEKSVGCFVSGGLGSATIAAYLSQELGGQTFPVFNVGFQGQNEEDIEASKSVADTLGLPFISTKITKQNFLQDIVKIAWVLDEPLADPNVVATWNLSKLASKQIVKVFSGMGSDELLAGHSRYSIAERDVSQINRLMLLPKPFLIRILIPFFKLFYPQAAFNLLKVSRTNPWQFEYLRANALFDENKLSEVSPKLAGFFDPDTFLHKFHHLNRIKSIVSSFLYFDVKTRLPDSFIFQYNRITHAHHLDWRMPFLDRELVEFAAHLAEPETLKESETASYLKPLVNHIFSPDFFNRPKKTRKYFLSSWMNEPQIFNTMKLLTKGTLVDTGFISEKWLKEQFTDPLKASTSFRYLFAIMMLEVWFRLFINRPVHTQPPALSVAELLSES